MMQSVRVLAVACLCSVLFAGCTDVGDRGHHERPDGPARGLPHDPNAPDIHPVVWADNRAWGPTFEFKVNCGPQMQEHELEPCFLTDLDMVTVHPPNGTTIFLDPDFEIDTYSGEVTRRWVLYGPDGAGLPEDGDYLFRYHRNQSVVYEHMFRYASTLLDWPTDIVHERRGDDLFVRWTPPVGASAEHSYKILTFPERGGVFSKKLPGTATEGTLADLPFDEGEEYLLRVSIYWSDQHNGGGYATGPQQWLTW